MEIQKAFLKHLPLLPLNEIATSARPIEIAEVYMAGENCGNLIYIAGLCTLHERLEPYLVYTHRVNTHTKRGITRLVSSEDVQDYRLIQKLE